MRKAIFLFYLVFFVGLSGFAPANFTEDNIKDIAKEQVVYVTKTGKK